MKKYLPSLFGIVALAAGSQVYAAACTNCEGSMSTSDVTFGVQGASQDDADACALISGNAPEANPGSTNFGFGGDNFDFIVKDQTDSIASGSWWGIDFTLTGFVDGDGDGTYTLTWSDPSVDGSLLPKTVDLVFSLKAGPEYGVWLFNSETLTDTNSPGSGEWEIHFLNGGGKEPGLSHLNVYMRHVDTPTNMPEPGTLGMLMIGFIGAGLARRRKTKQAV